MIPSEIPRRNALPQMRHPAIAFHLRRARWAFVLLVLFGGFRLASGAGPVPAEECSRELDRLAAEHRQLLLTTGKEPAETFLQEYEKDPENPESARKFLLFEEAASLLLNDPDWVDFPPAAGTLRDLAPAYLKSQSGKPDHDTRPAVWFAWLLTGNLRELETNAPTLSNSAAGRLILAWARNQSDRDVFRAAWEREIRLRPQKVLSLIVIPDTYTNSFRDDVRNYLSSHEKLIPDLPLQVKLQLARQLVQQFAEQEPASLDSCFEMLRNDRLLTLLAGELPGCRLSVNLRKTAGETQQFQSIESGWETAALPDPQAAFLLTINGLTFAIWDHRKQPSDGKQHPHFFVLAGSELQPSPSQAE